MRLTLHTFLSLDGVMQAPGGPDEDTDGGFAFGGWSFPFGDEDFAATMVGWFGNADAFLLGRRTFEIFAGFWPGITEPSDPIASKLNALPKYVASTTLKSVEWANSSLLGANIVSEVERLKARPGNELQVHGSGNLARTLIDNELVDEYRLLYFPVHLGSGKRLFEGETKSGGLLLTSVKATASGIVVTTYVPDGPVRLGSYLDPARRPEGSGAAPNDAELL